MNIKLLSKILPLAGSPLEIPGEGDIESFIERFGDMPADYFDFLRFYGTGSIDDFLWIYNVRTANKYLSAEVQIPSVCQVIHECVQNFQVGGSRKKFPYDLESVNGRFVPFGISDNGDWLIFRKDESSGSWSIVIMDSDLYDITEYHRDLGGFLCDLLQGKIRDSAFPEDFPSRHPEFLPEV